MVAHGVRPAETGATEGPAATDVPDPAAHPDAATELASLRARLAAAERRAAEAEGAAAAARRAVADAESRFAATLESLLDGLALVTSVREGGEIVGFQVDWANEAAAQIVGVPRERLVGHDLRQVIPSLCEGRPWGHQIGVVETGEPVVIDGFAFEPQPGRRVVVDVRITKLGDGYTVVFRDVSAREAADEERFRSEEMLQLVLDTIPQHVFWKDLEGNYVGCNASAAADLGLEDPSQVVGLTDFDLWPAVASAFREGDRRVMESGVAEINVEDTYVRPDGEGWMRTSKLPLRGTEGEAIGVLVMCEDITEHRRAEEALRRSEQFLDSVVENIPDMILVKDARDLHYVRVNRAGAELLGRARSELIGKTDADVIPSPDADAHMTAARLAVEERRLVDTPEERCPAGPLGVRYLHTKRIPILDEAGQPIYLLSISEDVTERKVVLEALRESEERYRRIADTTTDYLFAVKVEDGLAVSTVHGPGCVGITGYSADEFAANPRLWIEMVVPEDRELAIEQAVRLLRYERPGPIEHRIIRKDGALRWVHNTLVPSFDADGTLVGFDGLIKDITERRVLQEQLLQAQKMESIGRLAGGVAHDFNNLLTAILGYLEMARLDLPADLPADHPVRSDLDEVTAAGERAASLTRQLLAFASKQIMAPVRLDLSALVADSLKMLRRLLGENISVETMLDPAVGSVEADPGQIQQLLVNLTVNAKDAMPTGGRLVIETATETVTEEYAESNASATPGRYVRLSVIDTGCGMTDEVRSHLFEPFFTTKERGKGTGLGLATCHGIVRQMGGHIRVSTEPGTGTTFNIYLPQVGGPADLRPALTLSPTPTGTETVLLVEDEPVVRRLAVLGLRAQGYRVLEASDGVEALEIAERVSPDLVVSDVIMPGISGPELVRRLLAVSPKTRVLLVSGHAEDTILPPGQVELVGAFLPKPFTPERLARKVRDVLDAPGEE